jgi:hypothetical protein
LNWFGFHKVLVVNAVISALFIAAPALFTAATPIILILLVLFVGGFFRSLQFTCINAISYAEIDQAEMSQATSFTSAFQQLALSLGVTISAAILQLSLAFRSATNLVTGDFTPAFLAVALVALVSAISFARLPRDAGKEMASRKRVGSAAVAVANSRS